MPANNTPSIDQSVMLANYGVSMALMNSDPEISKLFSQAVAETWDPSKFQAALRNTQWWVKNSQAARNAIFLQNTDPATWQAKVDASKSSIASMARQYGANLDSNALNSLASTATQMGWSNDQLLDALNSYIGFSDGTMTGRAAQYENDIRSYANAMGIRLDDNSIATYVRNSVASAGTDGSKELIAKMAASAFPNLADRINAGETLDDIAAPYKQSMANILEINPNELNMWDSTLRGALSGKDEKGQPSSKSLWQFENDLRKDARWQRTQNAQDSYMKTATKILGDWGLM